MTSNRESENKGIPRNDLYSDILMELEEDHTGIVIEVKYAENGMEKILKYGIACYKKKCRMQMPDCKVQ